MQKQKGFSLIELLIVVAIILIIAAIAVPNLMRSRMSANEASAVGSVRTIVSAELTYQSQNSSIGFDTMANLNTATLIDSTLAGGSKSGYGFAVTLGSDTPVSTFVVGAAPLSTSTGTREFCSDQTAVIRVAGTGTTVPTACAATLAAIQ